MIKILFLHWKLVCGGAESALYNLVKLMDKSKFDITIFVIHDGGEWEQKFRDLGVRIINSYSNIIPSNNIIKRCINHVKRNKINKIRDSGGKGLIELATNDKYDIVVSYHTYVYCGEAGFPKVGKSVKFIHGNVLNNIDYQNNIKVINDYDKKYDKIICVSNDTRDAFIDFTGINNNVITCFNPIDSEDIINKARKSVNISNNMPYICAIGRLSSEKGFDRLIRIHKRLIDNDIYHKLVIVGDGPEYEKLKHIIEETNTHKTVVLTGYQENPYPFIKNSLFVVCSSFTEGLPVISMEALCLGIPVVSSYPSVGELFGDKQCGIITKNDDNSLYNGMYTMLTDNEFYKKTKDSAELRSEYFSGSRMVKKIENVFYNLVKEGEVK